MTMLSHSKVKMGEENLYSYSHTNIPDMSENHIVVVPQDARYFPSEYIWQGRSNMFLSLETVSVAYL